MEQESRALEKQMEVDGERQGGGKKSSVVLRVSGASAGSMSSRNSGWGRVVACCFRRLSCSAADNESRMRRRIVCFRLFEGLVELVINVPGRAHHRSVSAGYIIRRTAVDAGGTW